MQQRYKEAEYAYKKIRKSPFHLLFATTATHIIFKRKSFGKSQNHEKKYNKYEQRLKKFA